MHIDSFKKAFREYGVQKFSDGALELLCDYLESIGYEAEVDPVDLELNYHEEDIDTLCSEFRCRSEKEVLRYLRRLTDVVGVTSDGTVVFAAY